MTDEIYKRLFVGSWRSSRMMPVTVFYAAWRTSMRRKVVRLRRLLNLICCESTFPGFADSCETRKHLPVRSELSRGAAAEVFHNRLLFLTCVL